MSLLSSLKNSHLPLQVVCVLNVLHSFSAVPSTALCPQSAVLGAQSALFNLEVTDVSAPNITGTTLAFTSRILFSSSFSHWHFSSLSLSFFLMLLLLGTAMSITTASLCFLSTTTIWLVWLVSQHLPVRLNLEVPQDL